MNTEQLTKLASFAGKSANDFWFATGKKPTDVIAELAAALIEANRKVQAMVAENTAHKSAFKTILEHCPVNHPDIDKAVVAMIAYDEAFNRESRDNTAAVAQIEAQGVDKFAAKCKAKSESCVLVGVASYWALAGEHAEDFAAELREAK